MKPEECEHEVPIKHTCYKCGEHGVSASFSNELLCVGQIKKGDIVFITFDGIRRPYDVEEVLNENTMMEEILLDIEDNLYFITSMALGGNSWAKDVKVNFDT